MEEILLISLKPKYIQLILGGEKRVELRKNKPRIGQGDHILLYTTAPVQALEVIIQVKKILKKPLHQLWEEVQGLTGETKKDFFKYYHGKERGVAIFIDKVHPLTQPLSLKEMKELSHWFYPPQGYLYLKQEEFLTWKKILVQRSSCTF